MDRGRMSKDKMGGGWRVGPSKRLAPGGARRLPPGAWVMHGLIEAADAGGVYSKSDQALMALVLTTLIGCGKRNESAVPASPRVTP